MKRPRVLLVCLAAAAFGPGCSVRSGLDFRAGVGEGDGGTPAAAGSRVGAPAAADDAAARRDAAPSAPADAGTAEAAVPVDLRAADGRGGGSADAGVLAEAATPTPDGRPAPDRGDPAPDLRPAPPDMAAASPDLAIRPEICGVPWTPMAPPCPSPLPRSCDELYQAGVRESGPYRLDPDGSGGPGAPLVSHCEMQAGVGGWTLIAKVNVADMDGITEPRGWFQSESRSDALATTGFVRNQPPSSHGAARLAPLVRAGATLARFDLHAQADPTQVVRWYKVVASPGSFTAWFVNDANPSRVCTNLALTMSCSNGIIAGNTGGFLNATMLGGMNLAQYGYSTIADIHMRLEGDSMTSMSGLCSATFNRQDNAWRDLHNDHWGNGLLVWLK